jgi:hypothetical protein
VCINASDWSNSAGLTGGMCVSAVEEALVCVDRCWSEVLQRLWGGGGMFSNASKLLTIAIIVLGDTL